MTYKFPANLEYLLTINNINREEFGKLIANSSAASVSTWITNKHKPSIDKVILISDYFKVNIDDLIFSDLTKAPMSLYELAYNGRRDGAHGEQQLPVVHEVLAKLKKLEGGQDIISRNLMSLNVKTEEISNKMSKKTN